MRKLVSVVLVLTLVLALGATAFADSGIYITKNPTDEARTAGGTAWFISGATGYNSLSWSFMSPGGTKCSVQDFKDRFPYVTVDGEHGTTLTLYNVSTDMNGWGVFCTFSDKDGSKDTAMAFLYVSAVYVAPTYSTPSSTNYNGYVPGYLYGVDGYDPSANNGYVDENLYAVDGFDPFA